MGADPVGKFVDQVDHDCGVAVVAFDLEDALDYLRPAQEHGAFGLRQVGPGPDELFHDRAAVTGAVLQHEAVQEVDVVGLAAGLGRGEPVGVGRTELPGEALALAEGDERSLQRTAALEQVVFRCVGGGVWDALVHRAILPEPRYVLVPGQSPAERRTRCSDSLSSAFAPGPAAAGLLVALVGGAAARLGFRTTPFGPVEAFEPLESSDHLGAGLEVVVPLGQVHSGVEVRAAPSGS